MIRARRRKTPERHSSEEDPGRCPARSSKPLEPPFGGWMVRLHPSSAKARIVGGVAAAQRPGGGTRGRSDNPYSAPRRRSSADARSASAAIVSDGFTQSEVGTADPSVTKIPG